MSWAACTFISEDLLSRWEVPLRHPPGGSLEHVLVGRGDTVLAAWLTTSSDQTMEPRLDIVKLQILFWWDLRSIRL